MTHSGSLRLRSAAASALAVERQVKSSNCVSSCFGADALVIQELSPRKLVGSNGHAF